MNNTVTTMCEECYTELPMGVTKYVADRGWLCAVCITSRLKECRNRSHTPRASRRPRSRWCRRRTRAIPTGWKHVHRHDNPRRVSGRAMNTVAAAAALVALVVVGGAPRRRRVAVVARQADQ